MRCRLRRRPRKDDAKSERRAAELKVGRGLADLGAAHYQAEVFGFNVLAAGFEAVVHSGLQTDLMAMITGCYAVRHGVFSVA